MSPTTTRRAGARARVVPEPKAAGARTAAADRPARSVRPAARRGADEPAVQPADEPAVRSSDKHAVKAAGDAPAVKRPATRRPAAKTTAKPAVKPVSKPAPKTAAKPVSRQTAKPIPKAPGSKPAAGRSAPARGTSRRPGSATRPVHVPAPRAPFVLLVIGLLGGALVSLLLLNTVLAEDAFTLSELQRNNKLLSQQRQALQEEIAREEAPDRLAQKAASLGMVQQPGPAFIHEPSGRIEGGGPAARPVPHAAAASAGVAGVVGVLGVVVPADELPSVPASGAAQAQPGPIPAEGTR